MGLLLAEVKVISPWKQDKIIPTPTDMAHEFDGKKYEQVSSHQKEWGRHLIDHLNLGGTERILDLGCGDGLLSLYLAKQVPRGSVLGIDASQGMIDAAKSKEQENLTFCRMDINTLDFQEDFDLIFSNAALHWIKDHRLLLANVHKALCNEGNLRFNFAGDGNCAAFYRVIREVMVHERFAPFFASFEWPWYMPAIEDYRQLAGSCGFKHIRVWGETADRYFPDQDALIGWIDQPSIVPFLSMVPLRDKKAFREFVVHRMIQETLQPDGTCFETFRRINVSAGK